MKKIGAWVGVGLEEEGGGGKEGGGREEWSSLMRGEVWEVRRREKGGREEEVGQ